MGHRRVFVAMAIVLTAAVGASAQTTRSAAETPALATTPAPATSAAEEPRYPSALPIPEDMIRRRPRQVIALPSEPGEPGESAQQLSSGVLGKVPIDAHRFPEGHIVAGVQASVESQADWMVCYAAADRLLTMEAKDAAGWAGDLDAGRVPAGLNRACQDKGIEIATEAKVIVEEPGGAWRLVDPHRVLFVQDDSKAVVVRAALPLRVLPNKMLMMLEAVLGNAGNKPPTLAVTGRITEFQGNNYILLEHLSEIMTAAPAPTDGSSAQPTTPSAVVRPKDVGDNAQESTASAPAGRGPRPEDIIKQLLDSKPRRAVVLPKSMPVVAENKPGGPVAEGRSGQETWPEETMLVDRPGRVVQSDKWWTFSFEDKGLAPGHRPIRLLPNRMLENAVALGGDKSAGVVLVVSGEVTEYRGANYLLLRKVLVQRDMGNLK